MEFYFTADELRKVSLMQHDEVLKYVRTKHCESITSAVEQILRLRSFADTETEYEAYSRMLRVLMDVETV